MPKKNDIPVNNSFKNKDVQTRKQVFTKKTSELINQMEKAKIAP